VSSRARCSGCALPTKSRGPLSRGRSRPQWSVLLRGPAQRGPQPCRGPRSLPAPRLSAPRPHRSTGERLYLGAARSESTPGRFGHDRWHGLHDFKFDNMDMGGLERRQVQVCKALFHHHHLLLRLILFDYKEVLVSDEIQASTLQ
jgi:hypothetical protein